MEGQNLRRLKQPAIGVFLNCSTYMSVFSQGLEEEVATLVLTVTGMYMNI